MVSFKLPLGVFAVFLLSQNFAFIGIKNGKKIYYSSFSFDLDGFGFKTLGCNTGKPRKRRWRKVQSYSLGRALGKLQSSAQFMSQSDFLHDLTHILNF